MGGKFQFPSFGRKSHGCTFGDGDSVSHMISLKLTPLSILLFIVILKTLNNDSAEAQKENYAAMEELSRPHSYQATQESIEKLDVIILPHLPCCSYHAVTAFSPT